MSSSTRTVRKRLDQDCLLDGDLHPNVAIRLERVRELPVRNVANLVGVERDNEGVWLVWQYVEGMTLESYLAQEQRPADWDRIARDLKRLVISIHAQGLVHGALHARNVIIDPTGAVWLTHISPLLFSEPEHDEKSLAVLLLRLGKSSRTSPESAVYDDPADHAVRLRAYLLAGAAVLAAVVMFLAILWYIRA